MDCIYCGEQMSIVKSWREEFYEVLWRCPYCHAQCDWSEPYGEEWNEGNISLNNKEDNYGAKKI